MLSSTSTDNIRKAPVSLDGQKMNTRLGEITIWEKNLITFQDGLLGFEGKRFFVISDVPGAAEDTNFALMQSLEDESLCFVMLNASLSQTLNSKRQPYVVDMAKMLKELEQHDIDLNEYGLGFIVSINEKIVPAQITINSSAPIVIHHQTNEGAQVVLTNPEFSVSQTIYG